MARGQIVDGISIALLGAIAIVSVVFGIYLSNQFHTGINNALAAGNVSVSAQAAQNFAASDNTNAIFADGIVLIIVLLAVSALIVAWFVPTNPGFLILEVLILAFFELGAALMGNLIYSIISFPQLAYIGNEYPFIVQIVLHYPLIIGAISVLIMIVQSIRASFSTPGPSYGA